MYGPDPFEACHTEESSEQSLGNLGWPSHVKKLMNSSYSQNEGPAMKNVCLNKTSSDFSTGLEPASVTSSNSLMGTFGKPLRRSHLDAFSSFGLPSDCQSRAFPLKMPSPDLDSESEDERERTDFQEDNHTCTHKQTLENYRTPNFQSYDLNT